MTRAHTPILTICTLLLLAAAGCGDDPAGPEPGDALTGRVLDADGRPVAGAAIGLVYRLEKTPLQGDWEKATTSLRYAIPEPGRVRVEIFDHAGDPVIVLVDERLDAGDHRVVWYGDDENGDPVPAGMYHAVLTFEDREPIRKDLFLYYFEPGEFARAPNAVTDAAGRFRIERALVATGAPIVLTDESGAAGADTLASALRVLAVVGEEGAWATCAAEVDLPPEVAAAHVELAFASGSD